MMQIYLTGTKPIFEEIVSSVRLYIERGVLKKGERMPSVRELALSLSVNPNTVMRAYQILTDEGLLAAIPKKGLYVAGINAVEGKNKNVLLSTLKELLDEGFTALEITEALKEIDKEE